MKTRIEKILPYLMILLGGVCVLRECFPGRLGFLNISGTEYLGWIFWTVGIAGVIWLFLRRASRSENLKDSEALPLFFRKYGIEIMILIITAASLSMLLHSGYYWDDARNSTQYLAEKKDSVSTWTHILAFMRTYLRLGRINLLSIYYYFFFYIENVTVYKTLIIGMILINQLIFRKTLLAYDVPLSGARLGMLLIPLMLQTRAYQDPVSGFYGLMQVLTGEMLLTALFLSRWLQSGRKRDLCLSLLCFGIGMMTYEVCFPFILMICLIIWVNRKSFLRAVRDSLPFVLLVLVLLGGVYYVRQTIGAKSTYQGVSFSLDLPLILRAGIRQIAAGLPLSYYSAGYWAAVLNRVYPAATFMQYDFLSFLSKINLTDVLIIAACFACFGWIFRGFKRSEENNLALLVLGLCFAVLPSVTIAISQRYQGQLMPGLGYLPIYMQYYGITMLLVLLTLRLKPSTGIRALCLSAFAVIMLLNLQNNRAVTEIMNRTFYDPRNAGEAALRGGILDFLSEEDILLANNDRQYLWEADWNNHGLYKQFYSNNSRHIPGTIGDNKVLKSAVEAALEAGAEPDADGNIWLETEHVWLITYNGGPDSGLTRLGHLLSAKVNVTNYTLTDPVTDRVLYFVSGNYPEQTSILYTTADGSFVDLVPAEQYRVRASEYGLLYQLPENQRIWFESLSTNLIYR